MNFFEGHALFSMFCRRYAAVLEVLGSMYTLCGAASRSLNVPTFCCPLCGLGEV